LHHFIRPNREPLIVQPTGVTPALSRRLVHGASAERTLSRTGGRWMTLRYSPTGGAVTGLTGGADAASLRPLAVYLRWVDLSKSIRDDLLVLFGALPTSHVPATCETKYATTHRLKVSTVIQVGFS